MKYKTLALLALGLLITLSFNASGQPAAPQIINPGQTVIFDQADDLSLDFSSCSGANVCVAQAIRPTGELQVMTVFSAGVNQTRHAQAILLNNFQISGLAQPERLIAANFSGSVSHNGLLKINAAFGDSRASIRVKVRLRDLTANNKTVAEQSVLYDACETSGLGGAACFKTPESSATYNLSVNLIRGHSYAFDVIARCESKIDVTAAGVDCLFFPLNNSYGVTRSAVRLEVARDLAEELDALKQEVDALRRKFESHRHHYLTGRGTGHNDVPAWTTAPSK